MEPLTQDFLRALARRAPRPMERRITLGVPESEKFHFWPLAVEMMNRFPGLDITVAPYPEEGTAQQIINALAFEDLGEELLVFTRHISPRTKREELEEQLGLPVTLLAWQADSLVAALLAEGWEQETSEI